MAKTVTAIIEENILKKINRNQITENKNILYKEAILDTLKKNKKIDTIIISEKIPGEINLIKLTKKIKNINKKIKIIIILYNKKIEQELIKNNIKDIYYNNIISVHKLIKKLKENKNGIKFSKSNNFKINKKNNLMNEKINDKKIKNVCIKKINNKINNNIFVKVRINKLKNSFIIKKIENNKLIKKGKNNIICIFGRNKINSKIIELIIIKKLLLRNKKIIKINLKINNKKIKELKNRKLLKINKIKNKYYLKIKRNYPVREKIINKNMTEIININKILKRENKLNRIKILKKLIKKYTNNKNYIIFNIIYNNINIKKLYMQNKNINIIVTENDEKNLLELNENKNNELNVLVINYKNNNLSQYFYKIILKNKFNKIKIIDI